MPRGRACVRTGLARPAQRQQTSFMSGASRSIRTPDQRLRGFVSPTLKEFASERRTARAAIERLHLAPLMFELGARPHPPCDLYRAYLEQSDVFVALYGERFVWIAPGEQVSGIDDEYAWRLRRSRNSCKSRCRPMLGRA